MGWKFYDANGVESIAQIGTVAITAGGTGAITAGDAAIALGVGATSSPTFVAATVPTIVGASTITLDADTDIELNADGGDIFLKNGSTTFGSLTDTSSTGNLIIKSGTTTAMTFAGANATIAGTLTVSGNTTQIDSTTLTVADTLIKLNQAYTGTGYDIGLVFTQGNGSATNQANRGFIWDSNETEFSTIFCNTEDGTTVGNVTINDYADLHVGGLIVDDTIELGHATNNTLSASGGVLSIQGNIIYHAGGGTDVPVADGGTGLGSYAQGDIVYYNSGITLSKLNKPGTPAGEVLTFETGNTAPTWVAAAAGVGLGLVIALGG